MVMRRKVVRLGGRRGREIGVERTNRKGPPWVAGRAAALDHGHPPHRSDAPRSTPLRRAVSWARPSPRPLYRELLAANHDSTVMRGFQTCARWQSWAWAARPRVKTVCAPCGARGPGAGSGLKRCRHHGCAVAAQTDWLAAVPPPAARGRGARRQGAIWRGLRTRPESAITPRRNPPLGMHSESCHRRCIQRSARALGVGLTSRPRPV